MTRDEAIKWLQGIEERYFHGGDEAYDKRRREAVRMAIEALERKRGIWMPIERGDKGYSAGDFICSCCGKPNKCYSITDYCCSCGAKMRGDND